MAGRAAVGYLRRSSTRQEHSIQDQRRVIQAYGQKHGIEIVRWYIDDISGTSVDARKAFKQMLADAGKPSRQWCYILVFDVSRFSRGDLDEAGHLRFHFRRAGVEVVYVAENLSGNDSDDLIVGVKQWMAQKYVKDLSNVTIRGQLSHVALGAWCGGVPPFGFDLLYHDSTGRPYQQLRWLATGDKEVRDPEGNLVRILPRGERFNVSKRDIARLTSSLPARIVVIRRIFSEYAVGGRGYKSIADGLNRDGIPSPRDGHWSSNARSKWSLSTIREIVRNPAYRGDTTWNRRTFAKFHRIEDGAAVARSRTEATRARNNPEKDWIVVPATHAPLVAPGLFDRAQELARARAKCIGPKNVRAGRGARSPYLLSGLVTCGRCGQNFQGRTVNSTKRRKDGSKIKTYYYACGAWVMKGQSACGKFLLRRDPVEAAILDLVQARLEALVSGEGEKILRRYIDDEIAAQTTDPARESAEVRDRIDEIDRKADLLLEGLSADARGFVEAKLRKLAAEKSRLEARLAGLDAAPREPIEGETILAEGLAALRELPRLLAAGDYEERKELVRAFVAGITVVPDELRLDLQIRKIPTVLPGDFSCLMVAGAGFEPATFGL